VCETHTWKDIERLKTVSKTQHVVCADVHVHEYVWIVDGCVYVTGTCKYMHGSILLRMMDRVQVRLIKDGHLSSICMMDHVHLISKVGLGSQLLANAFLDPKVLGNCYHEVAMICRLL